MYSVEQDMQLRLSEARDLIDLIEDIESGNVTSPKRINTPVLRASVVISLYNIIESTVTQALTEIHNAINSGRVYYNNLTKEIKELALIYFYKHKAKRSDIHDSVDALHHTVDLIRGKGFFDIPYEKMTESYQLYSGNLDARIIRKVMKKYGIDISESHGKRLKAIKDGRNTLAHGNMSFEEFGRDIVIQVLREYFNDTRDFLSEVTSRSRQFIEEKMYQIKRTNHGAKRKSKNQRKNRR